MSPKQLVVALTLAIGLPAWAAPPPSEDLLGRTVFQVLLGELALRQGAVGLSVQAWADLAERTRDPKVIARAVEVAGFAGDNARALALVELWLSVEPESTAARQAQLALLVHARQVDQLQPHLVALLASDKENLGENLLHLNRMLARIPDKQAVLRLLDAVLPPYLELPEARFALAQAALAAGDEVRALRESEAALARKPDWDLAAIARAKLVARQDAEKGLGGLRRFVDAHPSARDARLALAQMLVAEKRLDDARLQYERLLKDFPEEPAVLYPAAILTLQHGDREAGIALLERLLATPFADRGSIHYLLGQIAQEAGQSEQAIEHYRRVVSGDRYVAARARIATILLEQGKNDEALRLLRDTRGATPGERAQLVLAEAQLHRDGGREDAAYATLRKALETDPDSPDLLYDAALTAERLALYEPMEFHLRRLLKKHPDHAHALNALGYSFADRNVRLDEAEPLLTRAVELAPEDPFIMDSLGWLQYRQGKLDAALQTLQAAYRIKPDPEIAAHLAEVLWQAGRQDEARRLLQEAQRNAPDNKTLGAVIKKYLP